MFVIMVNKSSSLKELFGYAGRYKWLTITALVLSGLSALFALVPFIYIWAILREVLTVSPDYTRATNISHYGWMALVFAVISIFVYMGALLCSHKAAFRTASNIRSKLLKHIFSLPIGFMDSLGSGKIRKWVNESASSTETYLAHQMPDKAGSYATMLGLAVLMFVFDWRLGLLCIGTAILSIIVMFTMMTGQKLRVKMGEYTKALDNMSAEAVEYVRGVPVVKTFGQTVFSFKRFKDSIDQYQSWVIDYTIELRKPMVLYTTIVNSAFAVLIAATLIMVDGKPTNEFLLNLLYYIIISPSLVITLSRIMFASEEFMQVENAIDRFHRIESMTSLTQPENPQVPADNSIKVKNVSFKYPDAVKNAVESVSIDIPEGSRIAFVGPSGGGKTTLAGLIARFFDVADGEILIGGVNLKNISKEELYSRVSFVFQDSKLFKTTILENVRMGKPDATEAEVAEALHKAQCDDIINKLPNGMHTVIGTKGTYLSGGEQQRIAIARVILKNTPIVILDEATAFADPDNEVRVQQAFSAMSENKTVIMIAHRLSSIIKTDMIYVIEKGRIVESGNHNELNAKDGLYAKMWKSYCETIKWNLK